ncbi:unnamed protein product [Gemmataceae bacterium]|nr:unnamed protein product [Gemmataceae bacterium]VTU01476.1 unnamed protein product [Gemmataceae bacterium]
MNATTNGVLRSKRPQLTDAISKLDDMVDGLATAIPGAVADSVREVLGPALAAALTDAIRGAVKEAVTEALAEIRAVAPVTPLPPVASPPAAPAPRPRPDRWAAVRALAAEAKAWAVRHAAPVVARAALGWAAVRLVGGATVRSRASLAATVLTAAGAALIGYAAGPFGAAALLGLGSGAAAAVAVWAAPLVGLCVALRGE